MPGLLLNIDVPDLEAGIAFYTAALDLSVSRRFDSGFAELTGAGEQAQRGYARHWAPVHPDFTVADLDAAVDRALAAGAVQEGETRETPYGRIAMFADPFGHGFCLIEFNEQGYDVLETPVSTRDPRQG